MRKFVISFCVVVILALAAGAAQAVDGTESNEVEGAENDAPIEDVDTPDVDSAPTEESASTDDSSSESELRSHKPNLNKLAKSGKKNNKDDLDKPIRKPKKPKIKDDKKNKDEKPENPPEAEDNNPSPPPPSPKPTLPTLPINVDGSFVIGPVTIQNGSTTTVIPSIPLNPFGNIGNITQTIIDAAGQVLAPRPKYKPGLPPRPAGPPSPLFTLLKDKLNGIAAANPNASLLQTLFQGQGLLSQLAPKGAAPEDTPVTQPKPSRRRRRILLDTDNVNILDVTTIPTGSPSTGIDDSLRVPKSRPVSS